MKNNCDKCGNPTEGVKLHKVKINNVEMFCCSNCVRKYLGFTPMGLNSLRTKSFINDKIISWEHI